MSFFDYQRLDNILNLLIQKKKPVHIDELSSYCDVSDRTIRSDIKTINDYITDHGASIILIRKQGYTLEYANKEEFDSFWNNQDSGTFLFTSAESRLQFLIRIFLTSDDYIRQDYLQSIFFVSQNTLYGDLRSLKQAFTLYNLTLQNKSNLGYFLEGAEQDKRKAILELIFKENISDYITASSSIEKDVCMNIDYSVFTNLFQKNFQDLIKLDSDYFHRNLFTSLLLASSRLKEGKLISDFARTMPLNEKASQTAEQFFSDIEKTFDLHLSRAERNYWEFSIAENFPDLIDDTVKNSNQGLAEDIVNTILDTLSQVIDANWISDQRLKKNLTEHIKLFLNVQTIKGHRSNPILDTIKNNFPYAFDLAITCSQEIVRTYHIHFLEDEISYIALHFANAIERNMEEGKELLSLAIICGSGKTFSSIIESKIRRRFPNTFSKVVKYSFIKFQNEVTSKDFDLVISTVPINDSSREILFMDLNDLEYSINQIEDKIIEINKTAASDDLFSQKRFLSLKKRTSKEDLLKEINRSLLEQKCVTEYFLDDIYKREAISSTIIGDTIAIPHPLGDSVIKSTVFSVVAPKGISWDDKIIKFVFLFAIKTEDPENIQAVYDQLLDFIGSEKLQTQLLKEPSFETLSRIFKDK